VWDVNPTARDWAIRDYRLYLLREATPKRSVRYSDTPWFSALTP
jgi:hypothetical protein